MKLELLDVYNIRARLSASIILLAPMIISIFMCFEEATSLLSSSVLLCIFLSLTNYITILQRRTYQGRIRQMNYAEIFLYKSDKTIDAVSKERYYQKLAQLDESFTPLLSGEESETFKQCCKSAVNYLRNRTRGERLVLEENINYGFCKNLWFSKKVGIVLCIICAIGAAGFSFLRYKCLNAIPTSNYFAAVFDLLMLVFWILGVKKADLENASKRYAYRLLASIDVISQK